MTALPDPAVLEWAAHSVGAGAVVAAVHELRPGRSPWLLHIESDAAELRAVLKAGRDLASEIRTEVAALRVAEEHALAAPRVIAADLGLPAMLMTVLDGDSLIPVEASAARLRALGAAAAAIHRVRLAPTPDLPLRERHMPWIDLARERREGLAPTTPLLDAADRVLGDLRRRSEENHVVFVHGDLWAGNAMWAGDDAFAGTIDWEAAGVGNPGVDLGSLRLDAALLHGGGRDAADEVTVGWEEAAGRPARDVAVWDIVAALNTPPEMDGFLPTMHEAGRADLDGPTLTSRRDEFLEAALRRVGR